MNNSHKGTISNIGLLQLHDNWYLPQGPAGSPGPSGPDGEVGDEGPAGDKGFEGARGRPGTFKFYKTC